MWKRASVQGIKYILYLTQDTENKKLPNILYLTQDTENKKLPNVLRNSIVYMYVPRAGGGGRLNFKLSLFRNTFYFNQLYFRNHKKEGVVKGNIF